MLKRQAAVMKGTIAHNPLLTSKMRSARFTHRRRFRFIMETMGSVHGCRDPRTRTQNANEPG